MKQNSIDRSDSAYALGLVLMGLKHGLVLNLFKYGLFILRKPLGAHYLAFGYGFFLSLNGHGFERQIDEPYGKVNPRSER